jgi:fumarate reductase subunit D
MEDHRPARPSLALRLGITGARNLRADQLERIHEQLRDVFGLVKAEMERLASLKEVADSYASSPGAGLESKLSLITPLALGADRMAAREALGQGYEIFVPMPFPQEVYAEDFTGNMGKSPDAQPISAKEDLAEFHQFLSRASGRLEMDGGRGSGPDNDHSASRAYEAAGRFVVRHCDLLLAVWDGNPSNGRGGTAEIVHYAASSGLPVWWIHAHDTTEPEWLADIHDIQDPLPDVPEALSAEAKLTTYLARLILPPAVILGHQGILDKVASFLGEKEASPLTAYFTELPRASRSIWKTYSTVMNWSGGRHVDTTPSPAPPASPITDYWFDRYAIADARADDYADRYRSGYLLTILSTMTVLVCGACALGLGVWPAHDEVWSRLMGFVELGMLLVIIALILLAIHYAWHRKSIEYRLLAELYRKEGTLAALGWALSIEKVQQLADSEQLTWIGWLFAATQRGGPLPEGSVAPTESRRATLLYLIDEQLAYHQRREKKAINASRRLEGLGTMTFAFVLLFVLLKLVSEFRGHPSFTIGFGVIATVLAGVSAAFVAIRGYAELPLLAEQSHHMIRELHNARTRVARLDANRPLVSQDLGTQAAAVATLMLQDLDGWGRLFRGKLMEVS